MEIKIFLLSHFAILFLIIILLEFEITFLSKLLLFLFIYVT